MSIGKAASHPKVTAKVKLFGQGRVMQTLDIIHRWSGGLLGVLLAMLGITGIFLLHQNLFIRLTMAHAADAVVRDDARLADVMTHLLADPAHKLRGLRPAGDGLGVHRANFTGDGGAYIDQAGQTVTQWSSQWQRPEVWINDLHRHLFSGDTGEALVGAAGLLGLGFVITGVLLWWRTRSTFELRFIPKRLSRTALMRHHRDLGIIVAPFLVISFLTGSMMALQPLEDMLLAPFGPARTARAVKVPKPVVGPRTVVDWQALIATARVSVPDGELRYIAPPTVKEPRIVLRMRRPGEWTLNGRTMLYFDATGQLLNIRDVDARPLRERIKNAEYPLHAGDEIPLVGRWVMTISGFGLALLGTLAVWTFWFRRPKAKRVQA